MINRFFFHGLCLAGFLFFAFSAHADVKLPGLFSSNMMFQRGQENVVWGQADPGEQVQVSIQNQSVQAKADAKGNWKVKLAPMAAGGPFSMTIKGKNTVLLENILVGDIWLCSGQSNMAWPVQLSDNGKQEAEAAYYPEIRMLTVPQRLSLRPEKELEGQWQVAKPATVADFSAVAFFFGRHLHDSLGIPIGLIEVSWGGSMIEPWISADSLQQLAGMAQKIGANLKEDLPAKVNALRKRLKEEGGAIPEKDPGFTEHWNRPGHDFSDWKKMALPQPWEEGGLQDLDGVVWFKKEVFLSKEQAKAKEVSLELGPLGASDMVFFNGPMVGKTEGDSAAIRSYPVPAYALRAGRNVLAVRIDDGGGAGGFLGSPEQLKLKGPGWELPLAGEWHFKIGDFRSGLSPNDYPTGLFNAMIHPLIPFGIKGAIWYQGESNVNNAYQYRRLMPMLIEDWRSRWGQGAFPFLMVQLANFGEQLREPGSSKWAELREAQLLTARHHPNTFLAVTIDIGEGDDVHPRNKQEVGRRLALTALAETYGREMVFSGPLYRGCRLEKDKIRLFFDHSAEGLVSGDGSSELKGFAIAGEDGKFKWAKACIEGNSVVVYSEEVKNPQNVRYGWEDNPEELNLYNSSGLPASPFRTDVPE